MSSLQCLFCHGRVNQALHRVTVRVSLGTVQPVCTNTHCPSKLRPPTAPRCWGQPRILATVPLPLTEHQPQPHCLLLPSHPRQSTTSRDWAWQHRAPEPTTDRTELTQSTWTKRCCPCSREKGGILEAEPSPSQDPAVTPPFM